MLRSVCALIVLLGMSVVGHASNPLNLRTFGKDGPVTIYVFTSPTCPHCAAYHDRVWPVIMKDFIQTGKAQVKIVEMPYDAVSRQVVQLARCLDVEKYHSFMSKVYRQQAIWRSDVVPTDRIMEIAESIGMSLADQRQCLARTDVAKRIVEQRDNLSDLYRIHMMPSTVVDRRGKQPLILTGTDVRVIQSDIATFLGEK